MQIHWQHPHYFPDWEDTAQMHTHLCDVGVTKSSKWRPESQAAGQPGASLRGRSNMLPGKNPAICPLSNTIHWPLFPGLNMCEQNGPWPRNGHITIILTALSKLTHFRPLCSQWSWFPTVASTLCSSQKITKPREFEIFFASCQEMIHVQEL